MLSNLLRDESGFVVSTELILVATILVIGMVVGLTTVRDQVVTELSDVADAISALDQSYAYSDVTGHAASTAGTVFDDIADFCDQRDNGRQGFQDFLSGTCTVIDNGDVGTGVQSPAAVSGDSSP